MRIGDDQRAIANEINRVSRIGYGPFYGGIDMYSQYSDLPQVVPDQRHPEVVPNRDLPELIPQQAADSQYPEHATVDKYYHEPNVVSAGGNATPGSSNGPPLKPECICGLKPKKFYILLAVAVVLIVGAGVGGGVGGALASHSSSKPESSNGSGLSATITSASSISTTIPTATTTSAEQIASVTTTEVAGPTSTLYRDCPSSNNTLYSVTFGSDEYTYRKYCSMSLVDDGTTVVNEPTTNLNSCINLCAVYNLQNATEIASGDSQPCNAVCWRNGFVDDEFPGQCFGSTTQNSSTGGFNFDSDEIICDAAGWINQK